ncbi:glycosyltransferase family 2 protein [Lachnospiraceae bacterium C1.1]|nr:glycosyltransferase family 2 protein [Lachnospiraceae bacterium C1.1]
MEKQVETFPKVSVIIPVYNVEKYIQRCIESVLSQTYSNLEIIIVDDGSVDSSGKICDDYALKDNRISVIHQENQGQSVARNNAIKNATGDYYLFMDSDDTAPDRMVENLLNTCLIYKTQIAIGEFTVFTDAFQCNDKTVSESEIELCKGYEVIKMIHTVPGERFVVMWGKIFNADLFENVSFPEGRICEDFAALYRLYDLADKVALVKHVVYGYFRGNVNSSTFQLSDKFYTDEYLTLNEEMEFLRKKHPEYVQYAAKTYMYWLKDEFSKLFYMKKDRKRQKQLHKEYCKLYSLINIKIEKFYHIFRYLPELYCIMKK